MGVGKKPAACRNSDKPNQFLVLHRSVLSKDVELGQQVQLEMKKDRAVVKNLERSRGR
jgi:hypothetical protein